MLKSTNIIYISKLYIITNVITIYMLLVLLWLINRLRETNLFNVLSSHLNSTFNYNLNRNLLCVVITVIIMLCFLLEQCREMTEFIHDYITEVLVNRYSGLINCSTSQGKLTSYIAKPEKKRCFPNKFVERW